MSYGFEVIDQAEFCQSQFAGQQVGPENPATVGQLDDIPVHRRRKSNTGGARQIAAAFIGFVAGKGGPCGGKAHMIGDLVLADFTQAGGAVCVKPCACEPGVGAAHIDRYDFFHNSVSIAASIADRKSTRLNSSHYCETRMPSSA